MSSPPTLQQKLSFVAFLCLLLPCVPSSGFAQTTSTQSGATSSAGGATNAPSIPGTETAKPTKGDNIPTALTPAAESALVNPLPSVLSGGSDHSIKYWDAAGRLYGTVGTHDSSISAIAIAFVPDKHDKKGVLHPVLISGGKGGQLKIWAVGNVGLPNATPLQSVQAHMGGVTALAVSADGKRIATGGADACIRLWDLQTCQMLGEFKAHDDTIRSLQFSKDGSTLVSGADDRLVRIWKVGAPNAMLDYQSTILAHESAVTAIALSPDASTIASVSSDGYLKLWNIHGGSLIRQVHVSSHSVLSVAFAPKGNQIATGDSDGRIRIWNVPNGSSTPFSGSHTRGVHSLAWTPDGALLISGGDDKALCYWNVVNSRQIARITAHDGAVETIALMP